MKDKNPIDNMRFYIKSKPNEAVKFKKDQVSQMLPQMFHEKTIRMYCKKNDKESIDLAKTYVEQRYNIYCYIVLNLDVMGHGAANKNI